MRLIFPSDGSSSGSSDDSKSVYPYPLSLILGSMQNRDPLMMLTFLLTTASFGLVLSKSIKTEIRKEKKKKKKKKNKKKKGLKVNREIRRIKRKKNN